MTTAWYRLREKDLKQELQTDSERGLTDSVARQRLAAIGPNELPEPAPPSPLNIFFRQFSSLIIWVLVAAAVVSGLLHEWIDSGAILAIVVLNAILGFIQEFRAEQSLAALRKLSVATARVIRSGIIQLIPARELVPGDLIQVEAGDRIPADGRLISAISLQTQEASLTGESTPVTKATSVIEQQSVSLGDQQNMLFMGTIATYGKGRALVTGTGIQTELGKIATLMQREGRA